MRKTRCLGCTVFSLLLAILVSDGSAATTKAASVESLRHFKNPLTRTACLFQRLRLRGGGKDVVAHTEAVSIGTIPESRTAENDGGAEEEDTEIIKVSATGKNRMSLRKYGHVWSRKEHEK